MLAATVRLTAKILSGRKDLLQTIMATIRRGTNSDSAERKPENRRNGS